MQVFGWESVRWLLEAEHYEFKLIANEQAVVLFPHTTEHRDAGRDGIWYADNYQGNALAAMVKPGRIEFRFHSDFSDARVRRIAEVLVAKPELTFAAHCTVTYQNRLVLVSGDS